MDSEELLSQLADIHLPAAVGWWPPAPGWWILGLLLMLAAGWLGRDWLRRWRRHRVCRQALAELQRCHHDYVNSGNLDRGRRQLRYLNEFNSVLRRVALVHFPQAGVASLGGHAWVDFIRRTGDSGWLDDEIAGALSYGRFMRRCEIDVDAMDSLGQAWITSVYLGRSGHLPSTGSVTADA